MDAQALVLASMSETEADPAVRIGALFDAHHRRIYRLARRLSRSHEDASDAVQETFLRAARSPRSVPSGASSEEAWLVRVLINLCKDRWRQAEVRGRAGQHAALAPVAVNPEPSALAREMVWQALDALPPRRRAILVMYELEGTTIPAIARLLGVAAVTVRWHLSVGRKEMAKILGGRP